VQRLIVHVKSQLRARKSMTSRSQSPVQLREIRQTDNHVLHKQNKYNREVWYVLQ